MPRRAKYPVWVEEHLTNKITPVKPEFFTDTGISNGEGETMEAFCTEIACIPCPSAGKEGVCPYSHEGHTLPWYLTVQLHRLSRLLAVSSKARFTGKVYNKMALFPIASAICVEY